MMKNCLYFLLSFFLFFLLSRKTAESEKNVETIEEKCLDF